MATNKAIATLQESRQAAEEAVKLLKVRGIEKKFYDSKVNLSPANGVGHEILWGLYWAARGKKEDRYFKSHEKELREILRYVDKDGILTAAGSNMFRRLQLWYMHDECD